MARIYKKQPTISYVSKHVDISRQATHKFIKKLESKGLVKIQNVENNNKDKCIQLTALGEECYEKNEAFKEALIKKIANQMGEEKLAMLHSILKMDWGSVIIRLAQKSLVENYSPLGSSSCLKFSYIADKPPSMMNSEPVE